MFRGAFRGNSMPHSAIRMHFPCKLLHATEPDLRFVRIIGARAFVNIETSSKMLELKALSGRLVGYSNKR